MEFEQIKRQVVDASSKCGGNIGVVILADAVLKLVRKLEAQQITDFPKGIPVSEFFRVPDHVKNSFSPQELAEYERMTGQQDWPDPNKGQRIVAMQGDSITHAQLTKFFQNRSGMSRNEASIWAGNLLGEYDIREKM